MTKFLNSGFEREFSQNINQVYDCMQCSEPITNPVCHACLGKSVKDWLNFYPSVKKKFAPELVSYLKEINNNVINSVVCVACQKNQASLCPYCFIEGLYNLLRKNKIDKMIIMDFLSTFNFDIDHESYVHDIASLRKKSYNGEG